MVVPQAAALSAMTLRPNKAIVRFMVSSVMSNMAQLKRSPAAGGSSKAVYAFSQSQLGRGGVLSQRNKNNKTAPRGPEHVVTDRDCVSSMFMNTTT
jgi:hypothetical protein